MSTAVIHPSAFETRPFTWSPISCRLPDTRMTTTKKGEATMPLISATKTSNLIGFTLRRLRIVPPSVPTATRP